MTQLKALSLILLALWAVAVFVALVFAQTPAPAPPGNMKATVTPRATPSAYMLTDPQMAALHEAQADFFAANRTMQKALNNFNLLCTEIGVQNHWPKGTRCDIRDLKPFQPTVLPASK
jgi:hypothetical protein